MLYLRGGAYPPVWRTSEGVTTWSKILQRFLIPEMVFYPEYLTACKAPYRPQALGQAQSPPTAPPQQPDYQTQMAQQQSPSHPSGPAWYTAPSPPHAPAHQTQTNYHKVPPAQPHQFSPAGGPAQSAPTYQPQMSYQQPPQAHYQQQNAGKSYHIRFLNEQKQKQRATGGSAKPERCLATILLCLCGCGIADCCC